VVNGPRRQVRGRGVAPLQASQGVGWHGSAKRAVSPMRLIRPIRPVRRTGPVAPPAACRPPQRWVWSAGASASVRGHRMHSSVVSCIILTDSHGVLLHLAAVVAF